MLSYNTTPIQEIQSDLLRKAAVRILVKREDLNHPFVSGNKWWKLKYNIEEAQRIGKQTVLTFGGAYSNHIYATAAACSEVGLKSIGIIRGEETLPLNATLTFAKEKGIVLHYVRRERYRGKTDETFIETLRTQFGDFFLIPEGGTNEFAIRGTEEMADIFSNINFDHLFLPVGTGGTIAGLIRALPEKRITGVSVLKGDFLGDEIKRLLTIENKSDTRYGNWDLLTSYHHGGYAKVSPELVEFMRRMSVEHDLPLDPVYTGKLLWAVMEEVLKGSFKRGSTILALHTGGLQGANTGLLT